MISSEQVWDNIARHQGEEFMTVTGLPFTYSLVSESIIRFVREGHSINMNLCKAQVEKAFRRMPLTKTTDIADLRDYPYLYALLTDKKGRIVPKGL